MNGTRSSPYHLLVAMAPGAGHPHALKRAFELGHALGARLTVLQVIDTVMTGGFSLLDESRLAEIQELAGQAALAEARKVTAAHELSGVPWAVRIASGRPAVQIVECAEQLDADLIVVAAHQGASLREKVIGSTTDRVVRISTRPVLVTRKPATETYRRIIAAVDFSDVSKQAAAQAAAFFPGARLELVSVVHIPSQFEQVMHAAGAGMSMADYRRSLVRESRNRLRVLAARLAAQDARPRIRVLKGDPAGKLVRLTWNREVDLIAVGSRGHGAIRSTLLGSVAQRLLREAACDVLVAR